MHLTAIGCVSCTLLFQHSVNVFTQLVYSDMQTLWQAWMKPFWIKGGESSKTLPKQYTKNLNDSRPFYLLSMWSRKITALNIINTPMNDWLWLAKILTISEGEKKNTKQSKNTTHTYFSRKKEIRKTLPQQNFKHTQQIFFVPLFMQSIYSKTNYSSQFHIKNVWLWPTNYHKPTIAKEEEGEEAEKTNQCDAIHNYTSTAMISMKKTFNSCKCLCSNCSL